MALSIEIECSSQRWVVRFGLRDASRPIVVGRDPQADIPISSQVISRRHCLLFIHEGRWMIQDAPGQTGTFLNGQRVLKSAVIRAGDVVRLGPEEATITLTMRPDEVPGGGEDVEELTLNDCLEDEPVVENVVAENVAVEDVAVENVIEDQILHPVDIDATGYADSMDYKKPVERPAQVRQKGTPYKWIVVGVCIAGAAVYFGSRTYDHGGGVTPQRIVKVSKPEIPVTQPEIAPSTEPVEPVTQTPVAPVQPDVPEDPAIAAAKKEDNWVRVEDAHQNSPPATALVIYGDYEKAIPDSPLKKELEAYTDEALDLIWQQRVAELCKERQGLKKEFERLAAGSDTDANLHAKENVLDRLGRIETILKTEGGWVPEGIPNFADREFLAEARLARDPQRYAKFKRRVLGNIRMTRGLLPWQTQ